MRTLQAQAIFILGLIPSLISALPVSPLAAYLDRRTPQSYSVVAVDGGSSTTATPSPATKTVTDAVTQIRTSLVLSTITATPSSAYVNTTTPSSAQVNATTVSQTITYATTITQTHTLSESTPTATTNPAVSFVPYDNGQWHTTYYFRSTVAPTAGVDGVASTLSTNSSAPAPTTSIDPGQWAAWSGQNNGQ